MTHCIYASGPLDQITCSSPSVLQWGTVNVHTCLTRCPYRESPRSGFFAATTQLAKTKSARPVKKKKCGSCSKKKVKQEIFKPEQTFDGNGKWTIAVTTSPRKSCTLDACLSSIVAAGWPKPIVFAEPGSTETKHRTIANKAKRGVWHNWLQSARWCLENTDSEYIMTVQDDSEFHPQSREFAESILWPSNRAGFVSLYTPKHYQVLKEGEDRPNGVHQITTKSLWGACALIWDRRVLRAVVNHRIAKSWIGAQPKTLKTRKAVTAKRKADPSMIANSDTAIGKILNAMKMSMWFVNPSPVSHIARYSTISHGGNKGRRNCYYCADNSKSLIEQVSMPARFRPWEIGEKKPVFIQDIEPLDPGKNIVRPGDMKHFILVRSAYTESRLSKSRLGISEATCIPSLAAQSRPVKLVVRVSKDDPILKERKAAFTAAQIDTQFITEDWDIPSDERTVVSRMDDDDVIPVDYVARVYDTAAKVDTPKAAIDWPYGYVLEHGKLLAFENRSNQFISVVSDSGLTPHDDRHKQFAGQYPVVEIVKCRGWIWVRHEFAITAESGRKFGKLIHKPEPTRWHIHPNQVADEIARNNFNTTASRTPTMTPEAET